MNRSVAWLTLVSFLAMGAGFLRELTVAFQFGTTGAADAFALTVYYVDGVTAVVITGLAGYMLVPIVTGLVRREGTDAAFRFLETCLLWATLVSIPIVAVSWAAPNALAKAIAPDFGVSQRAALAGLISLAVPACGLVILAGAMVGILQASAAYTAPVYGRAAFSLSTALALIVGTRWFGVQAGGIGLCLGATAQAAVLVGALRRAGWRPQMPRLCHPALGSAVAAGLPTLLALLLTNVLMGGAQRFAASGLPEGGLAAVNYAQRTVNLVSALTMSLATVSLTELSLHFHTDGIGQRTADLLRESLESGLFFLIPLSCLFYVSGEPLIALLFQRGRYDAASASLTVSCLHWLTLSIAPGVITAILHRAAPAFGHPWRATAVSAAWAVATIAFTVWLLPSLGAAALTAGFASGMAVAALCSAVAVRDMVGDAFFSELARYFIKIAALAAVATLPALAFLSTLPPMAGRWTPTAALLTLLGLTVVFGTSFGVSCAIVGEPRWQALAVGTRRALSEAWRVLANNPW